MSEFSKDIIFTCKRQVLKSLLYPDCNDQGSENKLNITQITNEPQTTTQINHSSNQSPAPPTPKYVGMVNFIVKMIAQSALDFLLDHDTSFKKQ